MKACRKCGQEHPLSAYYPDKRYKDGWYPWCADCRRTYREVRKTNPEKVAQDRKRGRDYYQANKDKVVPVRRERDRKRWQEDAEYRKRKQQQQTERYRTNPEYHARRREQNRAFYQRHRTKPEFMQTRLIRGKVHVHRRRLRVRNAGPKITSAQWLALCAQYDHRCLCCGEQKPLTLDHIKPLSRGGDNSLPNIQPLCYECNMRKATQTIDYRPAWES